jgi:hypothetical protein
MNFTLSNFFRLTFLTVLILFLNSCEQIIEVNLKNGSPETVIEGFITNGNGPFTVKLSNSQNYFNQGIINGIDSADVEISDSQRSEKLMNIGSGIYATKQLRGISGKNYTLKIKKGEKSYTSSLILPPVVKIDTVYFQKGLFNSDSLSAFVQFQDPQQTENYYRIRVIRNGLYAKEDYNLVSDAHTNGMTILAPVFNENFAPGDKVEVELWNLNPITWKYFKGLSDIIQNGASMQAPGNPVSNISGGALGYFGAWGIATFEIIVPKPH